MEFDLPEGFEVTYGQLDAGFVRHCPRCGVWMNLFVHRDDGDGDAAFAEMNDQWNAHRCQPWKRPWRRLRGRLYRMVRR